MNRLIAGLAAERQVATATTFGARGSRCWLLHCLRGRVLLAPAFERRGGSFTMVGLVMLSTIAAVATADPTYRRYDDAQRTEAAHFERELPARGESTDGFANYWLAGEVSALSRLTVLPVVESHYYRYNANAFDLCERKFSYVLAEGQGEAEAIIKELGEPLSAETLHLGRSQDVRALFYDPSFLRARLVEPGIANSREFFPEFACPPRD